MPLEIADKLRMMDFERHCATEPCAVQIKRQLETLPRDME